MILKNNEIFIVLANLMNKNGELNTESKQRVDELIKITKDKKNKNIIFCGWAYREDSDETIASAQKKYFLANQVSKHNIFMVEESRDTVGDAVFSRKLIDRMSHIKIINVITSDYHVVRTRSIFNFVFGKSYEIKIISAASNTPKDNVASETRSVKIFRETFSGVAEGDIENIFSTMFKKHPFYNGNVY